MIGLLKDIVYLPISLKENSKRISGNFLSPLEAQNKDIGRCFADVTNQSEVTSRLVKNHGSLSINNESQLKNKES